MMNSSECIDKVKKIIRRELKVSTQLYIQNQELCVELGRLSEKVTHLELCLKKIHIDIQTKDSLIDKVIEKNNILDGKIKDQIQVFPNFQQTCRERDGLKSELEYCLEKLNTLNEKNECSKQRGEKEILEESSFTLEMCMLLQDMRKYKGSLEDQLTESKKCTHKLEQELKGQNGKCNQLRMKLKNLTDDLTILKKEYKEYQQCVQKIIEYAKRAKESNPCGWSQSNTRKRESPRKLRRWNHVPWLSSNVKCNQLSRNRCDDNFQSCVIQEKKHMSQRRQRFQSTRKCRSVGLCKNSTNVIDKIGSNNLPRNYYSSHKLTSEKQSSHFSSYERADSKSFAEASPQKVMDEYKMTDACDITIKLTIPDCSQRHVSHDRKRNPSTKCCTQFLPKSNIDIRRRNRNELNYQIPHCPKTTERSSTHFYCPKASASRNYEQNPNKWNFRNKSFPATERKSCRVQDISNL